MHSPVHADNGICKEQREAYAPSENLVFCLHDILSVLPGCRIQYRWTVDWALGRNPNGSRLVIRSKTSRHMAAVHLPFRVCWFGGGWTANGFSTFVDDLQFRCCSGCLGSPVPG